MPLIDPQGMSDLWASTVVMGRVIYAVVLRESRTRYGNSDLGYFWALIEPLIELVVLLLVFTMMGRTSPVGVPLPVFLVTGLMPFKFFKECVSRGATGATANQALLTYPQVKVLDIVIGRVLLEAATICVVYVIFIFGLHYTTGEPLTTWRDNIPGMIGAILSIFYFGLAFAIFSCALSRLTSVWMVVWGFMSRPLWFTSGIFFTLEHLPHNARAYAIYNPIAHMLEWWRSVSLSTFNSTVASPSFVLATATVVLFIGLGIDRLLNLTGHSDEPSG